MKKLRTLRKFKKLLCSMAIALALCLTSIGSVKVNATEIAGGETVDITIDNSASHLAVRFYPDSNDLENFEGVEVGATETYTVLKNSVARIRLYIQADGYYVTDEYTIEGATKLTDDDRVNRGWCRAAYTITADATKTIVLPEASVCTHPYADPNVRWGYYDRGDGTHAQCCTLCASDFPGTIANHVLSEMTATEYVDWYYSDSNFEGVSEENIASWKAEFIAIITEELGVDASTKIKVCTICEYWEKIENTAPEVPEIPSETPETPETPSETPITPNEAPTVPETSASLKDTSGVLPEGTTISSASVTSGEVYEKATSVVKEKIKGLGQFAVMEINLTDASNVQIHELNGYVQVSIPVPSNIGVNSGKTIVVYRLEDDGRLTRCQTTVENGVITFLTNHFSTYIVVEEDAIASPKTGDDSYINYIICILFFMTGIGLMATAKRKMI